MAYNSYKEALEANPKALAAITAVGIKEINDDKTTIKEGITDAELQWRIGQPAINQELMNNVTDFDGVIFNITMGNRFITNLLKADPNSYESIYLDQQHNEISMQDIEDMVDQTGKSDFCLYMESDDRFTLSSLTINGVDKVGDVTDDQYEKYVMLGDLKSGDVYDIDIELSYEDADPTKDSLKIEFTYGITSEVSAKVDDSEWTTTQIEINEGFAKIATLYEGEHTDSPKSVSVKFTSEQRHDSYPTVNNIYINDNPIEYNTDPIGEEGQAEYSFSFKMSKDIRIYVDCTV